VSVYRRFAAVYDLMGADHHSVRMVAYTRKLMRRFKIEATAGLDLCCGTGSAIAGLLECGLTMAGLDRSAEMLAVAAKKLRGRHVTLYQKSLPRFRLLDSQNSRRLRRFDIVTSFYDSLNYLSDERELRAAFDSVYRHLRPGGWFIFDMNTARALKMLWSQDVYADVRSDLAWVWKNTYYDKTRSADCHATFFVKKGCTWQRFDELHTEYAYDNSTVRRLLKDAGFQVKGFYRCFTFDRPAGRTCRICGVVRRPPTRRHAEQVE